MQTMTRNIPNRSGQEETWLDQAEAAAYIERTPASLRTALLRYTKETGIEIEKLPDGNKVFVKQSDLNELIKVLYPMQARKKGLI